MERQQNASRASGGGRGGSYLQEGRIAVHARISTPRPGASRLAASITAVWSRRSGLRGVPVALMGRLFVAFVIMKALDKGMP
jgi:hypothetical protein